MTKARAVGWRTKPIDKKTIKDTQNKLGASELLDDAIISEIQKTRLRETVNFLGLGATIPNLEWTQNPGPWELFARGLMAEFMPGMFPPGVKGRPKGAGNRDTLEKDILLHHACMYCREHDGESFDWTKTLEALRTSEYWGPKFGFELKIKNPFLTPGNNEIKFPNIKTLRNSITRAIHADNALRELGILIKHDQKI
jgi:hypothetical protein